MTEKLIMNIGASDNFFGAYSENCDGIYASAETLEEVKQDVYEAIRLIKKNTPFDEWPEVLKGEYEIVWRYDTQSLLKHLQGILSNAALERLTGINQKQLWNYANGISKPRKEAREKINTALHRLGSELIAFNL